MVSRTFSINFFNNNKKKGSSNYWNIFSN